MSRLHLFWGRLFLLLVWAAPVFSAPDQWVTTTVDPVPLADACPQSFAINRQGTPVIAYLRDGACPSPYLATWSGGQWDIERIFTECLDPLECEGTTIGLAVDDQGHSHVILDTTLEGAQYSHRDTLGWTHETISTSGVPTAIAVDQNGDPNVILQGDSQLGPGWNDIYWGKKGPTGWNLVSLEQHGQLDTRPHTLALVSPGSFYLGVRLITEFLVFQVIGGIVSSVVYSHGDYLSQPVALDTDNNHLLHVAFIDRPLPLHMSYGRAPHFSLTEIPAYSLDEAFQPNVAVGSDDHPRIAFLSNGSAVFGEWSGVGFSTETLAFGVPGREGKLDLGLGKEDRPYLLARDLDPHSYDGTYIRLAAKLPPPLSMTMSSRTATSIQWTWPTPTSNAVTGFRLRRTHDQSDLSGILPATATHWTAEGLSPNTTISADLETLFPGFVLTSGPVTAVSFAVPPKNVHLSRSGSGHLSATWSANGNTAGTTYRLDFHAPGNTVLSATANSPTHVYPFLSLQAPYALNVTALSGDGVPSPLATITSVTSDGRRTRMVFVVEELTVETTLAPLAGFAHPVFAAGPANDFPPNADSLFTPTGRGFQLEMDHPLPENQSATVAVNYPIGWLDSPSPLVLARFNTERAVWVPLPTRQEGQRLIATVDGFGLFQVMARSGNNLTISNVTAYPNPFRPGNGNTLTLKNLPPDGRAKIMTLNGQLVRSMTGNETGLTQWDGLTDDGIPVNSGVYVLAIEQNGAIEKLKVIVEQ